MDVAIYTCGCVTAVGSTDTNLSSILLIHAFILLKALLLFVVSFLY
uniref:Uncharacterized protein n=1 Tax=Anguilla anguilla TaxID=7936 RepID=A0A0E9X470_ANGAN